MHTWYMGTSKLSAPTPKPATKRPIMISYHLSVAAIWTMIPMEKMPHHTMMLFFLPMKSAMGAAISAPNSVPIDSSATIRPDRTLEK